MAYGARARSAGPHLSSPHRAERARGWDRWSKNGVAEDGASGVLDRFARISASRHMRGAAANATRRDARLAERFPRLEEKVLRAHAAASAPKAKDLRQSVQVAGISNGFTQKPRIRASRYRCTPTTSRRAPTKESRARRLARCARVPHARHMPEQIYSMVGCGRLDHSNLSALEISRIHHAADFTGMPICNGQDAAAENARQGTGDPERGDRPPAWPIHGEESMPHARARTRGWKPPRPAITPTEFQWRIR